MLTFDLNQPPPTAEEITEAQQEIERRLAAQKRKTWAGLIVVVIGLIGMFIAVASVLVAGHVPIFAAAVVVVVAGVFSCACICGCDGYRWRLSSLDAIPPSGCDQLIADCLADPLCEAYRQKVAALGRKPVKAETKVIREWVAGADAREKERREGIACAMIASKEPLMSDADVVFKKEQPC
jgi:hypothetical protein